MKQHLRNSFCVIVGCLATVGGLNAATFTYLDGSDNNVEVYTSAANMAAGTQDSTGAFASPPVSGFGSLAFDGTNFYGSFDNFLITWNSLSNVRSDTRVSTENLQFNHSSSTQGLATSDGSLFWLIFEGDTLIPYSSKANLLSNTQGLSGQGNTNDNITPNWDMTVVRGFGFDGDDYYIIRDVASSDNDLLTVHDTIAAVGTDTRLSTTTIDAGAGGTVPALSSSAGLAVTPVPEPTTYALISGLLLSFAIYRRKRQRA